MVVGKEGRVMLRVVGKEGRVRLRVVGKGLKG
jgi:hypothetical protein